MGSHRTSSSGRTSTSSSNSSSLHHQSGSDRTFSSASWSVVCPTTTTLDDQDEGAADDSADRSSHAVYVDESSDGEGSSSCASSVSSHDLSKEVSTWSSHKEGTTSLNTTELSDGSRYREAPVHPRSMTIGASTTASLRHFRQFLGKGTHFCGSASSAFQNWETVIEASTVGDSATELDDGKAKTAKQCRSSDSIGNPHQDASVRDSAHHDSLPNAPPVGGGPAEPHPAGPLSQHSRADDRPTFQQQMTLPVARVHTSLTSSSTVPVSFPAYGPCSSNYSIFQQQQHHSVSSGTVSNSSSASLHPFPLGIDGKAAPKPRATQMTDVPTSLVPVALERLSSSHREPLAHTLSGAQSLRLPAPPMLHHQHPAAERSGFPCVPPAAPMLMGDGRYGSGISAGVPERSTDINRVASAAYSKALCDAARIQMMAAAAAQSSWAAAAARLPPQQPAAPIIIQNTTKAVAESELISAPQPPINPQSTLQRLLETLTTFWKSKVNRLMALGFTGAVMYIYWEWWQHKKRLELMQRRIDANPLLRLSQMLSAHDKSSRYSTGLFS